MKTLYSILVALMLFSPLALSLRPAIQPSVKIILQASDRNISQAALSAASNTVTGRLKDYCPGQFTVSVSPGKNQLEIVLKNTVDPDAVKKLVSRKGSVAFREGSDKTGVSGTPALTGKNIATATAGVDGILITLKQDAVRIFADMTRRNLDKEITLSIDGESVFSPKVRAVIDYGKIEITGKFTPEELRYTAALLNNGELPCDFSVQK